MEVDALTLPIDEVFEFDKKKQNVVFEGKVGINHVNCGTWRVLAKWLWELTQHYVCTRHELILKGKGDKKSHGPTSLDSSTLVDGFAGSR